MEKQKERISVISEMVTQITIVIDKLHKMQDGNSYGEIDSALYTSYSKELSRYNELDSNLKELTKDIDHSDKSEVQDQLKRS